MELLIFVILLLKIEMEIDVKFYMEVVNLKVKPKESFSGKLTKGYKFDSPSPN